MPSNKTVELRPSQTKKVGKLAFLKSCLKFVNLLSKLLFAINKLWDMLSKLLHYFN